MSKKIVERQRLSSFLACTDLGELPPPEDAESPDFLFRFGDHTIGVEVTGLVSLRVPGGDNPRQSSSVLEDLLRETQARYIDIGGPPAHVGVSFRRGLRIPRRELADLALTLAFEFKAGINRAMVKHPHRQPWEIALRHPAVSSIAAWQCHSDEVERWHPHRGGIVDCATAEDVLATLSRKEAKLSLYRRQANEVWLLIVCDLFADGLLIDPPEEPVSFAVQSEFNRVFCLEWTGARAVEVPLLPMRSAVAEFPPA